MGRLVKARGKSALIIDHDIQLLDLISDRMLVFTGEPGRSGVATAPLGKEEGMNDLPGGDRPDLPQGHQEREAQGEQAGRARGTGNRRRRGSTTTQPRPGSQTAKRRRSRRRDGFRRQPLRVRARFGR